MREIKFRAWDKQEECYWSWELLLGTRYQHSADSIFNDDYELEQYTGLKDRNGVEIYENDGWKRGDFIGVVTFEFGQWQIKTAANSKCTSYPAFYSNAPLGEVIGNIHENPELLK